MNKETIHISKEEGKILRIEAAKRLHTYIKSIKENPTNFGIDLKFSTGQMGSMKRGSDIGISHLFKIIIDNPQLNLYWWLFGKGEMLLQNSEFIEDDELPKVEELQRTYQRTDQAELAVIQRDIEALKVKYFDLERKLAKNEN